MAESPYTRLFGERSVAAATFFYGVDGSSGVKRFRFLLRDLPDLKRLHINHPYTFFAERPK